MRKLEVDFEEILLCMESDRFDSEPHFDTQTGEVIQLPPDLDHIEGLDDEDLGDLPDWEEDLVPLARDIAEDATGRYVEIPQYPARDAYRHMERFAATVTDPGLREKLDIALDGKGAFGRFKRVLDGYDEERERWFRFKDEIMKEVVREWLAELDIEATEKDTTKRG